MNRTKPKRRWLWSGSAILATLASAMYLPGCTVAYPFQGPGYQSGEVLEADETTQLVGFLTHAQLDKKTRGDFDAHVQPLAEQLRSQPGLVGFSLRRELFGDQVWTLSIWRDESSLDAFVDSTRHRAAMRDGRAATLSMTSHEFEIAAKDVPLSWKAALKLLEESGEAYTARR